MTSRDTPPSDQIGEATPLTAEIEDREPPRSLTSEAWRDLRRKPLFWVAITLIVLFVVMAVAPQVFTDKDPTEAMLDKSMTPPSADQWFGRDLQGYDIYARTVYGARASILVGLLATICTSVVGVIVGTAAAYRGGVWDAIVMRITDVFFAIPFLLGGILLMTTFPNDVNSSFFSVIGKVVIALAVLGWPGIARLIRGSVLQVLPNDYVQAARALGASPWRIIRSHILPNAVGPVIVVATINLGAYIAAEATLSFLGIGLVSPAISWGVAISDSLDYIRVAPYMLMFPSLFLSLAVLAFIMLGDTVRDAFDPKTR
ncbi:MAG: peptide ABC transporter permease [Actinomycetales bacterium]|nr:MAG: peptide ABC transporter permease [Actinomycetales bacterium]